METKVGLSGRGLHGGQEGPTWLPPGGEGRGGRAGLAPGRSRAHRNPPFPVSPTRFHQIKKKERKGTPAD